MSHSEDQTGSGVSAKGRTRLSKAGNPRVRASLYMAAVVAKRINPDVKALYDRRCANGLRTPSGASAGLLQAALEGSITLLANVALVLEYEAVCSRAEHMAAAEVNAKQLAVFLDALAALAEPVESHFIWRPQLRDPADEMVLEAAVNGGAQAIVSFNRRDFGRVPASFGIEVLLPREALRSLPT